MPSEKSSTDRKKGTIHFLYINSVIHQSTFLNWITGVIQKRPTSANPIPGAPFQRDFSFPILMSVNAQRLVNEKSQCIFDAPGLYSMWVILDYWRDPEKNRFCEYNPDVLALPGHLGFFIHNPYECKHSTAYK